jgi:Fe-coproporphyrin III synthase
MVVLNVAKAIIRNRLGIEQYPSFVTFIVTWRCNSRCIFCDIWKKKSNPCDELSIEDIERIFQQLKKIDVLRLTGGEPFLRADLAEVINRINSVNPPEIIHITTNGFLTERILKTMSAINAVETIHIKVSIDAVGEKHDHVRGIEGAYEMAMKTVRGLCDLRKDRPFHIGVNQAIIDENEIDSYFQLRDILASYEVPVYPCIANDSLNSLYSDKILVNPNISYKPFGDFSKDALDRFMKILIADGKKVNNLQEQMVDRYHLTGLYNRIVHNKQIPNPKCVALSSHLRILPNGDVPVCLYNGTILGNLKEKNFSTVWFSEEANQQRRWVKDCPGCWQSCESAVSAIYTGDIWRGLLY